MKGRGHHHHYYYHDHDHHRPLSSPGALNGSVGPTPNSGPTEAVGWGSPTDPTHINTDGDDVVAIATSSSGGAAVTALQSFDISTPATSTALKSPGEGDMAAAALGYPFTSAQWKELERQAMIYKYMMASVPVPPDLLLPIIQSASHSSLGNGSLFNLSLTNNKDPEPWRCKRTDGKKWRCSRDAAPQQKYCERHMHRGRPRSRKPVEVHKPPFNATTTTTNKKSRLHHHLPPTPTTTTLPNSKPYTTAISSSPQLLRSTFPLTETDGNVSPSSCKENGWCLDWTMEGERLTMDGSEQQWQHFLQTDIGLTITNASVFQRACIDDPRNRIVYTDFGALEADQRNDDCALFLNPDLVCIKKQPQVETTPRGFIDAWSNDPKLNIENKSESSSVCSFSDLTLSMAMAAGNAIDEGMGQIPVGLGIGGSNDFKPQVWLGPGTWLGSNPGGPLAEVLRPISCAAVSSDPTSPHGRCNGDSSSSTPATRASSPSGVLQRAVLSLSDSSGCNSPTIAAASTVAPETKAFQWLG